MFEVGFGLGSNIGDKAANVRRAVREIEASRAVADLMLSSLYRTAPWGYTDQDWFINACAVGRTSLGPWDLLKLCLKCEARMGRERIIRWGPRNIDIDLLYYDDLKIEEPTLRLPHPQMINRAFVLVPLAELRPALVVDGVAITEAIARLDTSGIVRLDEAEN
ncbi:MAG: 2-amino-4-hydroxy-6-hydroxymethyldihydropteridine diphosphokinase [Methylobacteriaceae bacterium]|nr:2-amino-4-hydroxy-6-hydroxymethyldihydropteridine diphosphokinase [Methylobacteriaceae bacterium]